MTDCVAKTLTLRRISLSVTALALVGLVAFLVVVGHVAGWWVLAWQDRPVADFVPQGRFAYSVSFPFAWMGFEDGITPARLIEEGQPPGQPHRLHDAIRNEGQGRYCFWQNYLLFSTADNSDPRTNGRSYRIEWPYPIAPHWQRRMELGVFALLALAVVAIGFERAARGASGSALTPLTSCAGLFVRRYAALLIFLTGLALFAYNYAARLDSPGAGSTNFAVHGAPYSDARIWHLSGAALAQDVGFHAHFEHLRPGQPMYLGALYRVFGDSFHVGLMANIALKAGTLLLLFLIGQHLFSPTVGIGLAVAFASHALTWNLALTLSSENLGAFLTCLSIFQFLHAIDSRRLASFLLTGVWLGLVSLTRPLDVFAVPLFAVTALGLLWKSGLPMRRSFACVSAFLIGVAISVGPWLVRQYSVYGVANTSFNSAEALVCASSPKYRSWTPDFYVELPSEIRHDVLARYRYCNDLFYQQLRENPGFYVQNATSSMIESVRVAALNEPLMPLLVLFVMLAQMWTRQYELTSLTVRILAAATLVGACLGLFAIHREMPHVAAVAGLLMLPWLARRRSSVLMPIITGSTVLCLGIVALGGKDPRFLHMYNWMFVLGLFAFAVGVARRTIAAWGWIERGSRRSHAGALPLSAATESESARELRTPRWLRFGWTAVALFFFASGARIAYANYFYMRERPVFQAVAVDTAGDILRELERRAPGFLRPSDLEPDGFTTDARTINDPAQHGRIFVLRGYFTKPNYELKASDQLGHWARSLGPRNYDRTVAYVQPEGFLVRDDGPTTTRPAIFPGRIPEAFYAAPVYAIFRLNIDGTKLATCEETVFEGIAVVPGDRPDWNKAWWVRDAEHEKHQRLTTDH